MKTLKVYTEFVPGKHDISWIGSNFKEHLYDLTFTMPEDTDFQIKKLDKPMNDKEIQAELGPEPITLGDWLAFFKEKATRDGWYLAYVKDAHGVLWALYGRWSDGGWSFEASALDGPHGWDSGNQVFSRRFGAEKLGPQDKALGISDALTLPDMLTINGIKYKKA